MIKTLTEQWRNGTLPAGHYYCKLYYNGFKEKIQKCVKSEYSLKSCIPMSCGCEGEEVLAEVPTYDQFSRLVKKVEQLEEANKLLLDFKSEDPCCFDHQGYCQVHDSCDGDYKCIQKDLKLYFERYGVK